MKNAYLKSEFLQKLSSLKQTSNKIKNTIYIKHINLSRNSIEDKGAIALANILKEMSQSILLQFNYLSLSKCSLNSKGINCLAVSLKDYASSLNVLDLSSNNLKDDPVVSLEEK